MQTASFRIWTQVTECTPYDDKHHNMIAPNSYLNKKSKMGSLTLVRQPV